MAFTKVLPAGISTATNLVIDSINSAGVVTATGIVASTGTFSGNVSIAGTITYEDVTNIDSVGIITARSSVHVGAGISVVGVSTIGNTVVGGATTELVVTGNAKVTGILTVGQNSTTIDGAHEYPSIRPTLDLNFAATKTLDRRITFTRDSFGTYTDELGIVKYAPNNTPRFDHNPDTGESLGLLIEESRTNLVTHSEDFSNSAWAENGASESLASSVTAPDGTTGSVYELIENSSTSGHFMYDSVSVSSNTNYTWSVWMKANTRTYGYMTEGNTQGATAYFNLSTGTAISTSGTGSPSATAQKYPNGWVRCTMTFTTGASQTSANVQFGPNLNGSSFSYAGDGSSGIYVWGGQGEEGAFATSYIPTSGSTVTRAADIPKIEGTNLTSFYNDTEGTVFAEYQNLKSGDTNGRVWDIGNNANQTFVINAASSTTVQGQFYNSSGGGYEYNPGAVSATNAFNKVALGMKNNNTNLCVNGTLGTDDTSITLIDFSSAGTFSIGRAEYYSPRELNGCVRRLSYYNKRLPNAQLQGLTAQ